MSDLDLNAFNPEVEKITYRVTELLQSVNDEFAAYQLATNEPEKSAVVINLRLGNEYFLTTRDAFKQNYVIGGMGPLRSALENLADLSYMFKNSAKAEKYTKQYVISYEIFRRKMLQLKTHDFDAVTANRLMKQLNPWSGATIDDRLQAIGPAMATVYDMLSYQSHPNPASLSLLSNASYRDAMLNLAKQLNCMTALFLLTHAITVVDVESVTIQDIQELSKTLGVPINE